MNRPQHLIRKRMNRLLSAITDFPLTVLEAPAGYGKTTAVRDYLDSRKIRPLWIPFRPRIGYSEYCWEKVSAEASKLDSRTGTALKSLGFPADAPQRNRILSILNRLELPDPAVVVLDNYELVTDPLLSRLLLQIAEDEIENLHLVVLTRDTTLLDFAPLLLRGKCRVISQQQIKFTADEIRNYSLMIGSTVTDAEIGEIAEYTDGWISMIYMLLLGAEEHIPVGLTQTLDELIDQNMYRVHNPEMQHFLLQLSVMDSFTAEQAALVTGNGQAGKLLKQLQKKNAFIFYDEREKEYRIHNVLLDFLRARQNFQNEEKCALYHRLGEWLLRESDPRPAYSCLAKAGDAGRILAHLNRTLPTRDRYADFDGADELFASAPKELLYQNPVAYLRYLFYSIVSGKQPVAQNVPRRLDELETFYRQPGEMEEAERNRILGEILCVRKFTAFNRLEEMHAYHDEILRLFNGRQSSIMIQANEFTFGSPHYLYVYFRDAGSLKNLVGLCQQNVHSAFSDGCGTGSDSLALAEYACETGDYETALRESRKAVYKAETKSQWSVAICAEFNAMRAYAAMGNVGLACDALRRMYDSAEAWNSPVYESTFQLCRGYLYSVMGEPEKIPLWLRDGDLSSLSLFFGGLGFDKLVYEKALLAQGEYLKLEALSDSFDGAFGVFQNRLGFLHNAVMLAAARGRLYGAGAGLTDLCRALDLARPDAIVLPFAECASLLLPIFAEMPEGEKREAFSKRVLDACKQYAGHRNGVLRGAQELTKREIEVLALLAQGLNRNDIAQRLIVSPATVKAHLQSIYRKLEADGKVSALNIARRNGFI